MQIEEALTTLYGPLLSVSQLAKILHRSAEGLRISLRGESDWSKLINSSKLRLGRRVYYRTAQVAFILSSQ